MPLVYRSTETAKELPELGVSVRGGLAVVIQTPSEMEGLIELSFGKFDTGCLQRTSQPIDEFGRNRWLKEGSLGFRRRL
jgi:hypothetical protein